MIKEKLNILIVDDSPSVREEMAYELKILGYAVYTVASAEEAHKILDKSDINVLFLDFKLPGTTGLEYLDRIQREKEDIIVIMITAHESIESAVSAIEKGAYDYIIKPMQSKHIELILERALKRYQIDQERRKARAELKKRVNELEIFNKAAVDRELKMVKLKRRVRELEAEIKNMKEKVEKRKDS